ncbi:MAG: PKD domain-containing protein [Betaproteobacteria bacterium]|nr:PKD domain-containing protein [Betaproteobacteria bacterium]
MMNSIRGLALLALAACFPASAYAANATLACDGTWAWNPDTSTLTCVATTQNGPPTCSNLTPSTTLPDTAFSLTATCLANGGAIDRWEFAGPDATTAFIGTSGTNISGSIAGRAAGSYTFYVRASKDAGSTWGDWYSRAMTFTAVTVAAPVCNSISPTSATAGVGQTFSVNCSGILSGATYTWQSTGGNISNGSNSSHTVTYANPGSYAMQATVCNGSACSNTVNQTITVNAPQTGAISCTNISGITSTYVFPGQAQVYDLIPGNVKWWTAEQGNFTGKHAAVIAFRTPNEVSGRVGSIAVAEIGSSPTTRLMLLDEEPCATLSNYVEGAIGSTATVNFTVGTPVTGFKTLQPNTVYYVTITNRTTRTYADSCGTKDCSAIIELKL